MTKNVYIMILILFWYVNPNFNDASIMILEADKRNMHESEK